MLWFYVIAKDRFQENWRAAGLSLEAGIFAGYCSKISLLLSVWKWKKNNKYRRIWVEIPYNSANIFFKGPFFWGAHVGRGLSTEGNLRFKIDWASLKVESKFIVFALFYFAFGRAMSRRVFCVTGLGGLFLEGLIFGILQHMKWITFWTGDKAVKPEFFQVLFQPLGLFIQLRRSCSLS